MNNCLDRFAFIKTLTPADNPALFAEGMQCNYSLEEDDNSYMKYMVGAKWEDRAPQYVNELQVGTVFIGVSKTDSMSREYIVVAKDQSGNSIWYPFSGYDDAEPVVMVFEFKPDTNKFVPLCTKELRWIHETLERVCEPGKWYVSTTVSGELIPIFEVEDDDEDDWDWTDDDDDDDDDDEDVEDTDDDNFGTVDCVFSCLKQENGKLVFKTVAQIMNINEEVADMQHEAHHLEVEIGTAKDKYGELNAKIATLNELGIQFEKSYNDFQAATVGKFDIMGSPELAPFYTADKVEFIESEAEPADEPTKPAEDFNDLQIVETDIVKAAREEQAKEAIEVDTEAAKETYEVNPDKWDDEKDRSKQDVADTDGEIEQPKDYNEAGSKEPFGADDSKWEGHAEYDSNEDDKPADDQFGGW